MRPTWCSAVFGGDDQALGDLGVRQARDDQVQHLALARGELVALAARSRPAGRAELAQERRRAIGVRPRAEPLEQVARGAGRAERQGRARGSQRPSAWANSSHPFRVCPQ
jgi:hypothetical protein